MKKDYNYNYLFVFYDIKEKRVNKVFKICKKYLNHYQYSVFNGEITPANIIKLKNELNKVINKDEDTITFLKFFGKYQINEEIIGNKTERSVNSDIEFL